jgi:thymidylate synthase
VTTLKTHFDRVVSSFETMFLTAPVIEATKWQSTNAPAPMVELLNQSFTLPLDGLEDLAAIAEVIRPNLPWADRHFEEERVSGEPINPGETWKQWPYAASAAKHLREGENVAQYDHSYAERYWPKYAGMTDDGRLPGGKPDHGDFSSTGPCAGIRFGIGDLDDVVQILAEDPLTRQAYLPIFYPEDVAAARQSKRIPCTLGYHFIHRFGQLHLYYPMRSCDFIRHWRDDIYLTIRLQLWILDRLREIDPDTWMVVRPGTFRMHMTSLHMFTLDRENLRHKLRNRG